MYVACLGFFTQRGNIRFLFSQEDVASKPKHTGPPYNLGVSLEEGSAQKLWLYRDQLFEQRVGVFVMKMEKWGVHSGSGKKGG